ncbi:MAG: DNA-3-methyladenine glycosylase [Pirellulaceae bacterium]
MDPIRLNANWYQGGTVRVAQGLLGKTLARRLSSGEVLRGTIVEVEAYLAQGDSASHSSRGKTPGNATMFATPGTLYVYPIHSRHCLNVVTELEGRGAAVLIRAVEPESGITAMWNQRHSTEAPQPMTKRDLQTLTQGPGRLCEAFQVDRGIDGDFLPGSQRIWIEQATALLRTHKFATRKSPRIGISTAQERLLRFFADGNHFVSGLARNHSRGRTWSFFHGGKDERPGSVEDD